MTKDRKIVFWSILSAMQCMNSCTSQTLYSDSTTCSRSGPDGIKILEVLQQLFSNQAIKTGKLEKKLNSVKVALSKLNQFKIDQDIKTEKFEKKINSVEVALSKLNQSKIDQDIKTEKLEKQLNSVEVALSNLNQSKMNQEIETEMLEKKLNSVEVALSKLNQSKIDQDIEREKLEKQLNSVEVALSNLNQSKMDQDIETEMLEKELNSVKESLLMLMPDKVAFHVVANSSSGPGVIIFDHVISNIESGYDINSGIFSAPTTGFYVFSWSIETYGQLTEAALLVNGLEMGTTKSDQASSYYDTTTSFAVLNLTRKDKVWVRIKSGRAEAMHSMFSGWMISKKDCTAFYASLSRDVTGSPIIFNNEILDTDDAYSTSTGKFVAPRSGLYVFMMSALISGNYNFMCKFIFSNGISQPKVWVDSSSGKYDSSSYMTFAWMNSGDFVYVGAQRMMTTSMFAGWLLVDDKCVSKSTFPAFLAYLSSDSSRTPVVYDAAVGSYHHGYSTSTGVFTADRDGLYLFLYNTEAYNEVVRTELTVNGVEKFETRADGRRTEYDDTCAVTVLRLSANDRVYIEIKTGKVDEAQSLFFGILLFEI